MCGEPFCDHAPISLFVALACVLLGFVIGVYVDCTRSPHIGALRHRLEGFFLQRELLDVQAVAAQLTGAPGDVVPGTMIGVATLTTVQALQRPRVRRAIAAPLLGLASRLVAFGNSTP